MTQQIGRNVYQEERKEREITLSFFSKLVKKYYGFRIKMIEGRVNKFGAFSSGYRFELFHAAVYEKQAYLHKVEALYLKDELRGLKKACRKSVKNV